MYSITIRRVVNGYRVSVGCMQFVFTDVEDLIEEFRAYHERPHEREKFALTLLHRAKR
jgi:hypothetical protein